MPKKTRIRSTKQKKSTLQRQKQTQDVKQSVRVVVNLAERQKRRRPARKTPNAAPFRGEPIGGVSRFSNTPTPIIVSGNISDDQRKAIVSDGVRMMALDRAAQELNSAREEAIENAPNAPFLGFGGGKSETGSIRSFASSVSMGGGMLGSRAPSVKPSLLGTVDFATAPEVKERQKGGRKPDTSDQKIQRRFTKFQATGIYPTIYKDLSADEKADLQDIIAEYIYRNPIRTPQKTGSKKIGDAMEDLSEVEEI